MVGRVLVERVVEVVSRGGEVRHAEHYDSGSVFTVDIMLARPGEDFSGGAFVAEGLETCPFEALGDACARIGVEGTPVDE